MDLKVTQLYFALFLVRLACMHGVRLVWFRAEWVRGPPFQVLRCGVEWMEVWRFRSVWAGSSNSFFSSSLFFFFHLVKAKSVWQALAARHFSPLFFTSPDGTDFYSSESNAMQNFNRRMFSSSIHMSFLTFPPMFFFLILCFFLYV